MKTLSYAIFSIAFFFTINKECTAQFQPTYDNHFGAEFNPTGEPMGGHCCYSQIIDPLDATYVVSTVADFLSALNAAQPGDIIYIDDNPASYSDGIPWLDFTLQVDGTGAPYSGGIPIDIENLTIASGRGRNCSNGATLAVSDYAWTDDEFNSGAHDAVLFKVRARNFRLTGLRLDGPYDGRNPVNKYLCVTTDKHPESQDNPDGIEIDNCEIKSWNYTAIRLNNLSGAYIHHNFIHHSLYYGIGYGIEINKSRVTIEGNIFDYCRHAIAGSGFIEGDWSYGSCSSQHINGTRYLIRYNMFLSHIYHAPIDIHNTCHYCSQPYPVPYDGINCETTIDYSYACTIPNTGGEWLVIHHNSFYTDYTSAAPNVNDDMRGIAIGGYPALGTIIFNNWFKLPYISSCISQELYANCAGSSTLYYWPLPNSPYQTLKVFDNKFGEPSSCSGPTLQVWGTYANDGFQTSDYRTGDFNGDGNLDLLQITDGGEFYVSLAYDLANPTQGIGYHQSSVWGQNGGPIDIDRYRVADMNGDGLSDLISFESNGGIYVWLNTGNAFDSSPYSFYAMNGADYAPRYKIGDFNGDGNGDVICFEPNGGFYVWLSTGTSFNYAGSWGSNSSSTTPDRFKIGDMNGDNRSDVFYVETNGDVYVWISQGNTFGSFSYIAYNGACMGDQYNAYKTGDINGDSYCDLLSFELERIYVWVAGANGFLNSASPQNWIYDDGTIDHDNIASDACPYYEHREAVTNSSSMNDDFIIYPNPANGIFTLEFNQENNFEKTISVMDAVGSEMLHVNKSTAAKTIVDLSSYPKGVYFIKVTQGETITVRKIISM